MYSSFTGLDAVRVCTEVKDMWKQSILLLSMILLVGCGDPLLEVEENNSYHWQKYMNQDEFDRLEEGMTYFEVVQIAGGKGEAIGNNKYQWRDEILMTQAYIIEFKDDQLCSKEVIELRGHSNRS